MKQVKQMKNISLEYISENNFTNIKAEWNSLLEQSATNEFFLLWEWIYSWWNVFKDRNKKLYIVIGKNSEGGTIGIAPFYIEKNNILGLFNRKVIRFCSSSETYPDHLDFICKQQYEDLFIEAVFEYLKENSKQWNLITLDGVKENSIIKGYLTSINSNIHNFIIDCIPKSKCPYLNIDQSFNDYLKTFSGKKRYTILKKRKILLRNENIALKIISDVEEIEKNIKELFFLHAERSKRKGIKTTFYGDKIFNFHRNFITSHLRDNKIILAFLYENTIPLVSYYCIKHNNKYYYYQSGISPEGEKKSAGLVLLSLLIEKAFQEGCKEFDFLRGDEAYKYFWTKTFRQNYSVTIRKNNLTGLLSSLASIFSRKLKKMIFDQQKINF